MTPVARYWDGAAWQDIGGVQSLPLYTTTITGTGSQTSWTITHNLNTRDVFLSIREAAAPYEFVQAKIKAVTLNTVTVETSPALVRDRLDRLDRKEQTEWWRSSNKLLLLPLLKTARSGFDRSLSDGADFLD
jgi:hypothetical protein